MHASGYLVQYGRCGFVGRFAAADAGIPRDAVVVIRGPRGVELGTVLCRSDGVALDASAGGDLVRVATADDRAEAAARESTGLTLLSEAERRAADAALPITVLDAEVMLDASAAILHALPYEPCDADPLLAELSAAFGLPVRLLDVSRTPTRVDPPEPKTSCGKPDCGSASGGCSSCGTEKGGCSTGGCSRGSVKTADELTAYFADLRRKMDTRRTPLH